MTQARGTELSGEQQSQLSVQLKRWRDELLNLSRRNRALYFRHTKSTSFEIVAPDADAIVNRLMTTGKQRKWRMFVPPPQSRTSSQEPPARRQDSEVPSGAAGTNETSSHGQPARWEDHLPGLSSDQLLTSKPDRSEVLRGLKGLKRRADAEFVEKGLDTLYVAVGMLSWRDPAENERIETPLLFYPVTLTARANQTQFELERTEGDPVVNPALAMKLSTDFGVELPEAEDLNIFDPQEAFSAIEASLEGLVTGTVEPRCVLANFMFHKEAMYRDLRDNEKALAEHPMIQLLALGPGATNADRFEFDIIPEDQLDELAPPEELVTILDSDASQRQCIVAGRDGHSFVMDGPPGTGKSQTIANLIAELMFAGRSILFVSEKAAALDVVRARLEDRGLGDFLLELHSHKATRKSVASTLAKSLGRRIKATESVGTNQFRDFARRRRSLNGWAAAVNETRMPLGRSVNQVLGELYGLEDTVDLPLPTSIGAELGFEDLTAIVDSAQRMGNAWAPVERNDFVWQELQDPADSAARRVAIQGLVEHAVADVTQLQTRTEEIALDLEVPWSRSPVDANRVRDLLTLLESRPEIRAEWLTAESLDRSLALLDSAREVTTELDELDRVIADLVGRVPDPTWQAAGQSFTTADRRLNSTTPHRVPNGDASAASIAQLADDHDMLADLLEEVHQDSTALAQDLGADASDASLERCEDLTELADLMGSPTPPEAQWLSPLVRERLQSAIDTLRALVEDYRDRQEALESVFTQDVLSLDLLGLQARFEHTHKGLTKLRKPYRDDKKALAACTHSGKFDKALVAHLADAIDWQRSASDLERAESAHGDLVGDSYYRRESTDFDAVEAAVSTATRALELVGSGADYQSLAQQVALGGDATLTLPGVATRLAGTLARVDEMLNLLIPDLSSGVRTMPFSEARAWARDTASSLRTISGAMAELKGPRGTLTYGQVPTLLNALENRSAAVDSFERQRSDLDQAFGDFHKGRETDWDRLGSGLAWTGQVRDVFGGRVEPASATAMLATAYRLEEIAPFLSRYDSSSGDVLRLFAVSKRAELDKDLRSSFADALDLLEALGTTVDDIDTWRRFDEERSRLADCGLQVPLAELVKTRADADEVTPAIKKAVLEQWVDVVVRSDDRLKPIPPRDRHDLLSSFRRNDELLIANAAARVINATSNRRPASNRGAAAHIQHQAQLQRRHWPIHKLLEASGQVAQQLKPCFMMSPLSVSQYLPADLHFDVVIFDEASQVRPSDAVNCIYRAGQMIVAGDQKQLPPTSFFDSLIESDESDTEAPDEFESVLDLAKGAGSLPSLSLNWHYRSQHEDLITYSNYRFYEGGLWTFPSPVVESPALGVEMIKVDGVYRRGSTRDNPIEATKVVDRVVFHRRNHPNQSLGVVTFSTAQEAAIDAEIDRRRSTPELRDLDTEDRLDGFFVKNLESVQGDEREILIFSTGYGPDENGKITMNFGPVNGPGGWRRLNVAITRAKRRIELVTSLTAGDIRETGSDGIRHFKGYLDFAERGPAALALDLEESLGDVESPFEDEVKKRIEAMGFEVAPQVGVAGYRIDLAIRHPDQPGRYLMGVECDGAAYHSSKVARDRDRLREGVLAGLGWNLYRIWGISWYRDRKRQEERLREAINQAISVDDVPTPPPSRPAAEVDLSISEHDFDKPPGWATRYDPVTAMTAPWGYQMDNPSNAPKLRNTIRDLVRQAGAIHEDLVMQTIRDAWHLDRVGARSRDAFGRAVRQLQGQVTRDRDGFLRDPQHPIQAARIPMERDDLVRKASDVPPEELQFALLRITEDSQPIPTDELITGVARLFGWNRLGANIRLRLERQLEVLLEQGALVLNGDLVRMGS